VSEQHPSRPEEVIEEGVFGSDEDSAFATGEDEAILDEAVDEEVDEEIVPPETAPPSNQKE